MSAEKDSIAKPEKKMKNMLKLCSNFLKIDTLRRPYEMVHPVGPRGSQESGLHPFTRIDSQQHSLIDDLIFNNSNR